MQVLRDLQDTQAAPFIFRVCMGVCRVNFLLRALPQPLVNDAAHVFDDSMQETFASISCAVLRDRVWAAAQLPISTPDCPGLGLTSAKNIMSAAHLTSLNATRSVLSKLLPASLLQAFVSTPHVKSTFDDFRSRSDTSAPSFRQLCSEVRHEQKALVGHEHKKMAEELKQLCAPAELFRVLALYLTGAKEWLTAMPHEHDLRIPPHLMKWALATYLQAHLLQQPLDCSRCEQVEMDVWGLHVVVEPPKKWRLYQPCLYLRCCAGAICAVGWMDLMIILHLLLCLTRCEPR
jgi:hypothetical protein